MVKSRTLQSVASHFLSVNVFSELISLFINVYKVRLHLDTGNLRACQPNFSYDAQSLNIRNVAILNTSLCKLLISSCCNSTVSTFLLEGRVSSSTLGNICRRTQILERDGLGGSSTLAQLSGIALKEDAMNGTGTWLNRKTIIFTCRTPLRPVIERSSRYTYC